jgi:hypothetical protein
MSGKSNVIFWLRANAYDVTDNVVDAVFNAAKGAERMLTDEQIEAIVREHVV